MHSIINSNKAHYNHVLNKLQDYMLTETTMSNIFLQINKKKQDDTPKKNAREQVSGELFKKDKESERFFYPKEADQLFWCFYIIQHGFEKYEYPGTTSFVNEKSEKFKCIEHMRTNKQQLKSKKIKNIKEDVEDELANKQKIGMKTFVALCISHNINFMYIQKRKCFEMIFDELSPVYVIHCINNKDSSGQNYCYEQNVSKEQINKYRDEYFNWESFDKPLKAISSYKLEELMELSKKMGLSELSKKTKKELYEFLVMNL